MIGYIEMYIILTIYITSLDFLLTNLGIISPSVVHLQPWQHFHLQGCEFFQDELQQMDPFAYGHL